MNLPPLKDSRECGPVVRGVLADDERLMREQLRARLAEQLIEAGVSLDLQREMYLCSLFSQLDLLLHEPVANILRRTPLNERIFDAIVTRTGPYAAVLQMSQALESRDPAPIRQLREQEEWEAEDLNRMLLRMLSELKLGMPQAQT